MSGGRQRDKRGFSEIVINKSTETKKKILLILRNKRLEVKTPIIIKLYFALIKSYITPKW